MQKNSSRKSTKDLQIESFSVVNCKNQEIKPFLNVFEFDGSNFQEQKLGKIFGVIQILDHSENSAYIPNLIAQVIRKEFYRDPNRRDSEKSFEIALHKANLALSDLAQHEIVEWIGNLNSVIGIISKDNFYFTQVNSGKILLLRDKSLAEITQKIEISNQESIHPIKTFAELSFGKIQKDDKLIFASKTFFDTLRKEELKRHSNVFNSQEFDNILSSSLELEGENVGTIVVNVSEKNSPAKKEDSTDKSNDENFFGSTKKKPSKKNPPKKNIKKPKKKIEEEIEIEKENEKTNSPFEKEPELYIKEKDLNGKKESSETLSEKYITSVRDFFTKDKATEYRDKIKDMKIVSLIKEKTKNYKNKIKEKKFSDILRKWNFKKNKLFTKISIQGKKFVKSLSAIKPSEDDSKDRKKKLKELDKF